MDVLTLARWQFGITTVYHFILVPLTIGLSILVAYMQTKAYRTKSPQWERLTDFFGKIIVINFALGVATGIVQEFQFGMNWASYSEAIGDIFGAPLAFEALLAFFLESTFLGVWIFGKGRISKKLHALSAWLFAIGTNVSAFFILAANSFMQNPVGGVFNPERGRAELKGFGGFLEVLFQEQSLFAFAHTITSAFVVAGMVVAALSCYWIVRSVRQGNETEAREYWKPAAKFGFKVTLIFGILVAISGHAMAQHLSVAQPMKLAAAEGQCHTQQNAPWTLAKFGDLENNCENAVSVVEIPGAYSFLAGNSFSHEVKGMVEINQDMQKEMANLYGEEYGKLDYRPNVTVTYWSFRAMLFLGIFAIIFAGVGIFLLRGDRLSNKKWFSTTALVMMPIPFLSASFGWIFTEMGRQPWIVHPNLINPDADPHIRMLTQWGVSSVVQAWEVWVSVIVFTILYAALGVVWFWLIRRYTLEGINTNSKLASDSASTDAPLSFSY